MNNTETNDLELCGVTVHWWDGEYDGECQLPKAHLEPFHYDGVSYYDDDGNSRDYEQENLVKLFTQQATALLDKVEAFIGEDDPEVAPHRLTNMGKNHLRAEQRTKLAALKASLKEKI